MPSRSLGSDPGQPVPAREIVDSRHVVVFGTQRSASLARYCLEHDAGAKVIAFTVDAGFMTQAHHEGLPLVPFESLEAHFSPQDCRLLIPMGFQAINGVRRARFEAGLRRGYDFASYISSRARVWPDLQVGRNVMIYEQAIVEPFCSIGDNCIVRAGAHLSHHCDMQNHAFLAPEVAMGGGCRIGEQAFAGVGAILRDGITLAARSFVGAGAVVVADTEADAAYAGSPARKMNKTAMEASAWQ